uniref:Importin beta binding domain protein n=1 Tax=Pithovirus LCPAC302 TaxID=2506593 RepID=A0A481Z6U2_9VIRU|nr:MAG: importin beta binding domain protein [Pithovirus LCPAC302]
MLQSKSVLEFESIRKQEFKQGIDPYESRRKREDESFAIRKNKRAANLAKKRKSDHNIMEDTDYCDIDQNEVKGIYSSNTKTVLKSLKYCRNILSYTNPPVHKLISIAPKIVEFLSAQYDPFKKHQIESTWILINLTAGTGDETAKIVENTPVIKNLMECLERNKTHIRLSENLIWCLTNIAGDKEIYKNIICEKAFYNFVQILNITVSDKKLNKESLANQVWSLQNIVKKTNHSFSFLSRSLPVLNKVLKSCSSNLDIIADICWSLSYISNTAKNSDLLIFFNMGIIDEYFISLLTKNKTRMAVLRILGNCIAGPDNVSQKVLDLGYISKLKSLDLFSHSKKNIRREITWTISNVVAGTHDQIQHIIDHNIIKDMLPLMKDEWEIRKELLYVYIHIILFGTDEQKRYILNYDCIQYFCYELENRNSVGESIILAILKSFYQLLDYGKKTGTDKIKDMIEEFGGLDVIEQLQNCENVKIYNESVKIIEKFYNGMEEDILYIDTIYTSFN